MKKFLVLCMALVFALTLSAERPAQHYGEFHATQTECTASDFTAETDFNAFEIVPVSVMTADSLHQCVRLYSCNAVSTSDIALINDSAEQRQNNINANCSYTFKTSGHSTFCNKYRRLGKKYARHGIVSRKIPL